MARSKEMAVKQYQEEKKGKRSAATAGVASAASEPGTMSPSAPSLVSSVLARHSEVSSWAHIAESVVGDQGDGDVVEPTGSTRKARRKLREGERQGTYKWSPCLICGKGPSEMEAGMWGAYDSRGSPTGAFDRLHLVTCELAYPHMTKDQIVKKFHEDQSFKAEYAGACTLMMNLMRKDALPPILPASVVKVGRSYTIESFFEHLFMTEGDLQRVFGCGAKALKLSKPVAIPHEDGSPGTVSGYHVSMTGVPYSISCGLRKIRVSTILCAGHDDELMNASTQVRANQANDVLALALTQMSRPTPERCAGRMHVVTFQALKERADEVERNRISSAAPAESVFTEERGDNSNSDGELSDGVTLSTDVEDVDPVPDRPVAPTFSLGGIAAGAKAAPKKNTRKKAPKAKSEAAGDITDVSSVVQNDEATAVAIQNDTLLRQVARALDAAPVCLCGLIPDRTFVDNAKVGHQLKGARTILQKLKTMRSPVASLLESRIILIETCQVLQFRRVKQLQRAELQQHLDLIQKSSVQLPLRVRLDLLEVQTHNAMTDFFDETAGPIVEKTKEDAKKLTEKFVWYQELEEPVNELRLTAGHCIKEEEDLCARMVAAGQMPADVSNEKIKGAKEALAESLIEAFGNQAFLAVLGDPQKHKHRLLLFLECMADSAIQFEFMKPSCTILCPATEQIVGCIRGLLALLSPFPNYKGSTAAHANDLRKNSGNNLVETTIRDCVTNHSFWKKLWDDLVKKGSSNITMGPELSEMTSKISTSDPLDVDTLKVFVERLPVLKQSMRAGSTSAVEKSFYKKIVSLSREVEESSDRTTLANGTQLTTSLLDHLVAGLSMYRDTQGVMQQVARLESYKRSNCVKLSQQELCLLIDAYPACSINVALVEGVQGEERLMKIVQATRQLDGIDTLMQSKFKSVIWWHFRFLYSNFQEPKDALKTVNFLKELVGRFTDVYPKVELDWILMSLDSFALSHDLRMAIKNFADLPPGSRDFKVSFDSMVKTARLLQANCDRLEKLDVEGAPTESLGESEMSIFTWSWEKLATDLLATQTLTDALDMELAAVMEKVSEAQKKLNDATGQLHDPHSDSYWKAGLEAGADFKAVLELSKGEGSLCSLDASVVETTLKDFGKAIEEAKAFQKETMKINHMVAKDDWSVIAMMDQVLGHGRAFKAESLLCMALSQTQVPSCSKTTTNWCRDLVRNILGDIAGGVVPEDLVHSDLLRKCREMIR